MCCTCLFASDISSLLLMTYFILILLKENRSLYLYLSLSLSLSLSISLSFPFFFFSLLYFSLSFTIRYVHLYYCHFSRGIFISFSTFFSVYLVRIEFGFLPTCSLQFFSFYLYSYNIFFLFVSFSFLFVVISPTSYLSFSSSFFLSSDLLISASS